MTLENMLKLFHDNWLEDGGWAVIGIDHYAENEEVYLGQNMSVFTWQQGLLKNGKRHGKMLVSVISTTGLQEERVV